MADLCTGLEWSARPGPFTFGPGPAREGLIFGLDPASYTYVAMLTQNFVEHTQHSMKNPAKALAMFNEHDAFAIIEREPTVKLH